MPRQVPLTEYEAALLLDAYLKTLSGEKERMESVRDCSLQLRQMALNAGSEIDDIYRNVNGISFQMASMESAYQGHTIMKPATRLFTEIVFLYRNDAARYRQLLKEAKGMASAKIDNEAVFMAWLAQNASGVQLSELYLAFKEIEQQAKKVKIIRTSLYESLDPSTIKSNADLEALCEKIQAGGVAPIMFTGVDWSLGSHYLSQVFSGIQGDTEAQQNFINSLKDGSAELKSNDAWNSVMDTFDIIAKYNYNANDPLVGNTDIDGQAIAKGDVAMWFMGDWAWNYIKDSASADDEFGLMPCPLTGKEEDAVNTELGVFCSKGYCIDASQNSEEQQEAGKKLVEFFCVEKAQEMSDLLDMALPFSKVDVSYDNPLVASTQDYIANGAVSSTYAFSRLLPSDFWSENGAVMQQYLVGQMDRDTAADAVQAYWQAQ